MEVCPGVHGAGLAAPDVASEASSAAGDGGPGSTRGPAVPEILVSPVATDRLRAGGSSASKPRGGRRSVGSPSPAHPDADAPARRCSPAAPASSLVSGYDLDLRAWLCEALVSERRALADTLREQHSAMQAELNWRLEVLDHCHPGADGKKQRHGRSPSPQVTHETPGRHTNGHRFVPFSLWDGALAPGRAAESDAEARRGSRRTSASRHGTKKSPSPPEPGPDSFKRSNHPKRSRILSAALDDEAPEVQPRRGAWASKSKERPWACGSKERPHASGSKERLEASGSKDSPDDYATKWEDEASPTMDSLPQPGKVPVDGGGAGVASIEHLMEARAAEGESNAPSVPLPNGSPRALPMGTLRRIAADPDEGSTWKPPLARGATQSSTLTSVQTLPDWQDWLHDRVSDSKFEMLFAWVIMLNAVVIALEVQYKGFDIGFDLGYRWYSEPASLTWPEAETAFLVCHWIFGLIFTLEIALKGVAMRRHFAKFATDMWNWFDAIIVILFYVEMTGETNIPAGVLRVVRMARFMRLVKLLKTMEGFEALYLMTTAVKGSLGALTWSCALLIVLQMLIAFLLNQVLYLFYFDNPHYPLEERREVFAFFGTFSRAMLSMFEMTLANWPPICRLLQENVNEWFTLFCVLHKLTIGFAIIGVINGVFVQETFKVASTDDNLMIYQRERAVRMHGQKMRRLFFAADESGDGLLDIEEFLAAMSEPDVRTWMASMELDVSDAMAVFKLVDKDGDGVLTPEELAQGVAMLKGSARSIDLHMLRREIASLRSFIASTVEPNSPEASMAMSEYAAGQDVDEYGRQVSGSTDASAEARPTGKRRRRSLAGASLFGNPPTPTDRSTTEKLRDKDGRQRWTLWSSMSTPSAGP